MEPTNNNPVTNQPPVMSSAPTPTPTPEHSSSIGTVVAVIVVLAVIALGALYFWGQRAEVPSNEDKTLQQIQTQSSSDEPNSIEADLNSTNVDTIDAGLNAQ